MPRSNSSGVGRPRAAKALDRRSRSFEELPRILIACEGEKTEPGYFRGLCKSLGLTSAVVEVAGKECGSAPLSVCSYAIQRLKDDASFDTVYCVFDRDAHESFDEAMRIAREHKSKKIKSVPSYPCFEYWVLLHFRFSRAEVAAAGGKSSGARMLELVRAAWADYEKGGDGIFAYLFSDEKIEVALERAAAARRDAEVTNNPNPSTEIDLLVVDLRTLAARMRGIR